MKVLCLTHHSDRPETETLIGLKKRGVSIEIMCPSSAPYYENLIHAGITVTELTIKKRIDVGAIAEIHKRIKEKNHDIIHGFNNKAVSNGILASLGLPVKIVAYRGITGNVSFFNPGSWLTYLHPRVDRVICVAEAVRQYFLQMRFLGWQLSPEKFITIYKGHNLSWYTDGPVGPFEFGIPVKAFVVGCIANYRPRKGIHVLIDATRYLAQEPSIHLLIVGHMDSARLKAQIERSPFKERIHLAGYRTDAPALMAACDAFVLPALRREGLPKGVIEAMAYAVPPIVTDSGGSPELIENKKSGMIVPPDDAPAIADAIMYLFRHPETRHEIGQNARQRIRNSFRIEDTIAKTFDVYQELLT